MAGVVSVLILIMRSLDLKNVHIKLVISSIQLTDCKTDRITVECIDVIATQVQELNNTL